MDTGVDHGDEKMLLFCQASLAARSRQIYHTIRAKQNYKYTIDLK
jgi:hypothetical protein